MLDSHCHLADKAFTDDLDAVLARARSAGVDRMVTISDNIEESEKCVELAEKYAQIFCTVGVHPHAAREWKIENGELIMHMIRASEKVRAIGEIGLDYHYNHSPRDVQREVFQVQLELAKDLGLPAVVHCREAIEDVRTIIEEVQPPRLVMHCCCEAWQDVSSIVERGHFLSFTGIATYPKSETIRETIKQCPIENLMIETDAPYLAPVPHRGKRNEPAFVVEVAKLIAKLKGMSLAEVDAATTASAAAFFGMPT